jgi:hypothetical protein
MNKQLGLVLLAAGAIGTCLLLFRRAGPVDTVERTAAAHQQAAARLVEPPKPTEARSSVSATSGGSVMAASTRRTATADAFLSREELRSQSVDNLLARPTAAEAAWMRRSGYPTYDEWIRRHEIPISELEFRAARNDVVAQVMLGDRLGQSQPARAAQILEQALSAGSAFAAGVLAQQLSEQKQTSSPSDSARLRNEIFRLGQTASVLGDWRASEQIALRNGIDVTDAYNTSGAIRSAFLFLAETNAERQRMGLPPLQPTVRPGFLEWWQLTRGSLTPPETVLIDCSARPDLCPRLNKKP